MVRRVSESTLGLREETVLAVAWICLLVAGCGLLLGTCLSLLRDTGVVLSSMRSGERRVRVIWYG